MRLIKNVLRRVREKSNKPTTVEMIYNHWMGGSSGNYKNKTQLSINEMTVLIIYHL